MEEIDRKWEELDRKIYKGIRDGKITFNDHMDLRMLNLNIKRAIELEEYETAQIFQNEIDKFKI